MESGEQVAVSGSGALDLAAIWERALTFEQFVAQAKPEHQALWQGIHRHAKAPEWARAAVNGRELHMLAIVEDWCMDASNTIPFLARVAESVPGVDLRLVLRDANPAIMDRYLTSGARAIPVVLVLDGEFREVGRWGPRPSELQAWVLTNKDVMPKAEQLKEQRKWYARDKGETTIREVLAS